jgi:hypothetical protein
MEILVRKGGNPLFPYSVKEKNRVNSDKHMAVWNEICKMDDKLTPLLNAEKILVKRVKRDGHVYVFPYPSRLYLLPDQ